MKSSTAALMRLDFASPRTIWFIALRVTPCALAKSTAFIPAIAKAILNFLFLERSTFFSLVICIFYLSLNIKIIFTYGYFTTCRMSANGLGQDYDISLMAILQTNQNSIPDVRLLGNFPTAIVSQRFICIDPYFECFSYHLSFSILLLVQA
jgi:hypothetical protein